MTYSGDAEPVSQVPGIGKSGGQSNHSHLVVGVGWDKVSPRHYHLQHRTTIITYTYTIIIVNNYILSSYRFVIVVTSTVTRRTIKAKIMVM